MKRNYEKPNMDLEIFEANEYIAACDNECGAEKYHGIDIIYDNTSSEMHYLHSTLFDCDATISSDAKDGHIDHYGVRKDGRYWFHSTQQNEETKTYHHIYHFATNHS